VDGVVQQAIDDGFGDTPEVQRLRQLQKALIKLAGISSRDESQIKEGLSEFASLGLPLNMAVIEAQHVVTQCDIGRLYLQTTLNEL
jgi:hypothetical protein